MPELPEVEVIRRGLLPYLIGRKIIGVDWSGKKLRTDVPLPLLRERLTGTIFKEIRRRAKYLLFLTDSQDLLIIHLGMTGKLGICERKKPHGPHDHLFFALEGGLELRFNDIRRFGAVHCIRREEREKGEADFFRTSGPEPFSSEVTPAYLKKRAGNSVQPIKAFIMNSANIVGVGNIYANESLFSAGIHPHKAAGKLTKPQWQRLIEQIRLVLNEAIKCGGSTINDFVNAGGEKGYFQINFRVYGRDGEPCKHCGCTIKKTVTTGRATYFCTRCQKKS